MSFPPLFHTLSTLKLSDKTVFFRILKEYVWPYRSQVILATLCMLMFSGALTVLAKLMEPIINDIFIQKDETKLIGISFLIFGAFVVKGLGLYGENYFMNYVSLHLVMNIQKKILVLLKLMTWKILKRNTLALVLKVEKLKKIISVFGKEVKEDLKIIISREKNN